MIVQTITETLGSQQQQQQHLPTLGKRLLKSLLVLAIFNFFLCFMFIQKEKYIYIGRK